MILKLDTARVSWAAKRLVVMARVVGIALGLTARAWGQCPVSFTPAVTYPAGRDPQVVAVADMNLDGRLDLVVGNSRSTNGVTVLLGTGDGRFQSAGTFSAPGEHSPHVAVSDFNGDGRPDVAITSYSSQFEGAVAVLLGNGDGTLQGLMPGLIPWYSSDTSPIAVVVADFNRDGKADLAVARLYGGVAIRLGNGDGTFQNPVTYAAGGTPASLAAADFNGDGILDLAVANESRGYSVLLGNADGTMRPATTITWSGNLPVFVAAADLSGDGKIDLAVADVLASRVRVLLGNGNGTFQAPVDLAVQTPEWIAISDLNGDGKPDLVVDTSGGVSVLLGTGGGAFAPAVHFPVPTGTSMVAPGDFNADGSPDLAVVNPLSFYDSTVSILLNATVRPVILQPPACRAALAGQTMTMSVVAAGAAPLAYQWRRNGVVLIDGGAISGATTGALTVGPASASDAGAYDVQVSAPSCSARVTTSAPAEVAVVAALCPADFDVNGAVEPADVARFIQVWFEALSTGC